MTKPKSKTTKVQKLEEAFTVDKARWGTWRSFGKDGGGLVTSLTEESCFAATVFYLQVLEEKFTDNATTYNERSAETCHE
jgi:hypothetical protein